MTRDQPISITLSAAQVDQVVRAAAEGSTANFPTLIATTLIARAKLAEHDDHRTPLTRQAPDAPCGAPADRAAAVDCAAVPGERGAAADCTTATHDELDAVAGPANTTVAPRASRIPEYDSPRLSRSLLRGLSILSGFGPGREERGILELSGELGMSPSTTHRYVATLVELGLLERCPRSRKYRLVTG